MKRYTQSEVQNALAKIPKPVADFYKSELIGTLISGIRVKHKLTIMETGIISDVVAYTLLGLESESAVETNLHQEMPELSSQVHRELSTDINDRIFKEAQRRLRENIVEKETWDEEELGPKQEYVVPIRDKELEKRIQEEEQHGGFKPPAPPPSAPARVPTPASAPNPTTAPNTTLVVPPPTSIVAEKLAATTNITNEVTEVQRPIQKLTPATPPPPRLKGDSDPYRESV